MEKYKCILKYLTKNCPGSQRAIRVSVHSHIAPMVVIWFGVKYICQSTVINNSLLYTICEVSRHG